MDPKADRHRGWYSRGYLPHLDEPGRIQAITYRLADSLLARLLAEWRRALPLAEEAERRRMHAHLDRGVGNCALRDHRLAKIVEDALLYHHRARYRLLAWVVMPNHVHVIANTVAGHPIGKVVQEWKSVTARRANALLGRSGAFWSRDYHDRYVRDDRHLGQAIRYVHNNPVMAGLADLPADWPFSSARFVETVDGVYDVGL